MFFPPNFGHDFPPSMNTPSQFVPQDEISNRAHQIWIQAGRPEGRDLENWLQAERELTRQREKMAQSTENRSENGAPGTASRAAKAGRGQSGRGQARAASREP
jgi:hypothetical protein